jgi:hypothetical protein
VTDFIRLARPYFVLLALVTAGRWLWSVRGVPYERGHHVFSITALTLLASVFYGAFCRRWRGYRPLDAAATGAGLGLSAEIVIFVSTAFSYALGVASYFNHPSALGAADPVPFERALVARTAGLLIAPVVNALAGLLGWVVGALLPPALVPEAPPR